MVRMNKSRHIFSWGIPGLVALILLSCGGQNGSNLPKSSSGENTKQNPQGEAVMSFSTLNHDFGTIIEGERVVCYFDYSNSGGADLLITNVEASCGCTIPDWSREPLEPGEMGRMKIIFDASGRSGAQRKLITVRSNAANEELRLTIKANVIKNV